MKKKAKNLGKKPATMKAMKKAKTTKMSASKGKKKLPPALQKAIDAKKAKAEKGKTSKMSAGKKTKKYSITAAKPKVVKHSKKGRV